MRHLRRIVQYRRKINNNLKDYYLVKKEKIRLFFSNKLYVSFGENCLTDNILKRYGLKHLTTPFSHCRSNIEYILHLERDDYADFLNLDYLEYEKVSGKMVPRLKKYNTIQNEYISSHKKGFEFTHHDVISDEKVRTKIQQRVFNLKKLIGKKKFVIFYHHRVNNATDKDLLIRHLCELREIYSTKKIKSEIICFTQRIINSFAERSVSYSKDDEIHFFVFNTMNEWSGDDQEIFWARCDEDLIKEMVFFAKRM
jgi:Putative papain-like cysteine peptidase (DUF1796).